MYAKWLFSFALTSPVRGCRILVFQPLSRPHPHMPTSVAVASLCGGTGIRMPPPQSLHQASPNKNAS